MDIGNYSICICVSAKFFSLPELPLFHLLRPSPFQFWPTSCNRRSPVVIASDISFRSTDSFFLLVNYFLYSEFMYWVDSVMTLYIGCHMFLQNVILDAHWWLRNLAPIIHHLFHCLFLFIYFIVYILRDTPARKSEKLAKFPPQKFDGILWHSLP